jgi:hypothetical protein
MSIELKKELRALYSDASKHSTYQSIPDFVSEALGYSETIDENWRGDHPRLAYLLDRRKPREGEVWGDFGANTGFFTLSLARGYPETQFTAIEANPNHASFIRRIADYFCLANVDVINRAVGLRELHELPKFDFLLHLNVLHHAGHDYDNDLVTTKSEFTNYATDYLDRLSTNTRGMLFQVGSNWGGDKCKPLVAARDDIKKLELFMGWLNAAGWPNSEVAYPRHVAGEIYYEAASKTSNNDRSQSSAQEENPSQILRTFDLDSFPGEFYRRPLFLCEHT